MEMYLVSDIGKASGPHTEMLLGHVVRCARNPDPNSTFDTNTRDIRALPDTELVQALLKRGYDGLIKVEGGLIIGHIFWQKDLLAAGWKVFSLYTVESKRGQGHAANMVVNFIALAWQDPGVTAVQIGDKGNSTVQHIYQKILSGEIQMKQETPGIKTTRGVATSWISFIRPL